MIAIFFFVSQNEKEKDSKTMRERGNREKGKEKEMEEVRLILQTISRYVSVYVTCLKQSCQSRNEVLEGKDRA